MNKECEQFYKALANRESTNRHNIINKSGFLGLYQMGEKALIDAGYYFEDGTGENDWKGVWTGKNGIKSREDFLNNPAMQTKAAKEYHGIIFHKYLEPVHHMIGGYKDGIKLTESGMIAGVHLGGQGKFKTWLKRQPGSDQERKEAEMECIDGNNVPCSKYLKLFESYSIDCIPDKREVNKIIKMRDAAKAARKLKAEAWEKFFEFDRKLVAESNASLEDFKKEAVKKIQLRIDETRATLRDALNKECTELLRATFQSSEFKCGEIHPKCTGIHKKIKAEGQDLVDKIHHDVKLLIDQQYQDVNQEVNTKRTEKRAELRVELDAQIKLAYLAEGITLEGELIRADL